MQLTLRHNRAHLVLPLALAGSLLLAASCDRDDDDGPSQGWRNSAYSAPAHTQSIANIAETTVSACDPTGHCARMHVVVQVLDTTRIRSFTSITCWSASVSSTACAALRGSTWLNCTDPEFQDCGVDGPLQTCGSKYGKPACPKVLNTVSPWYLLPHFSQQYQGVGSFAYTTGAPGGGTPTIQGLTDEFGF